VRLAEPAPAWSVLPHCIVLTFAERTLLLEDVVVEADGAIKGGLVVNGGWYLELVGGFLHALAHADSDVPVGKFDLHGDLTASRVDVPRTVRGDYENVMAWAAKRALEGVAIEARLSNSSLRLAGIMSKLHLNTDEDDIPW
jgi:hypothetical protein